jgi:type IV secretion system protein VirB9
VRPVRLEPPARIIGDANKDALVTPSRNGYFGGRVEQRYIYQPGKVYLVVSSPQHPTTIILPPSERLAAPPVINECAGQDSGTRADEGCWVVGAAEMGSEATRSEVVILRPSKGGLESTMPLLTTSGRAYYVRLRSQETMGMIAVTWELPTIQVRPQVGDRLAPGEPRANTSTRQPLRAPTIALERLHTAYRIEVTSKQRPPWVPVQAFDDGTHSYIRFKEDLGFTASPAVFGMHADRTPAIVEFTPYQSPEGGLTYIVQGLYPRLVLRGRDGMEVTIVRGPHAR